MVHTVSVAQWDTLRVTLVEVNDSIHLTWQELESIVGELPPSASRYRAWWSGDRPHVRMWQRAGFSVASLELGQEVTFVRAERVQAATSTSDRYSPAATVLALGAGTDNNVARPDLLLVTCVKSKGSAPAAAKDLYVSALFKKQRAYAESKRVPWFVLSAEHGPVAPDSWIAPYERYLPEMPAAYRAAWGLWTAERLELLAGPLQGKVIEMHAGAAYVDAAKAALSSKGATVTTPLEGLALGERLAWYSSDPEVLDESYHGSGEFFPSGTASFVAMLLDESRSITPSELLESKREELQSPGLYSWWVDQDGASDLTDGLELLVEPGLIYAGLAGATRWPSGKRSANTLWTRVCGMHLGGNHEFSTFRKTLGSILAHAAESPRIDEAYLTSWMKEHLKVIAIPSDDPDNLGSLEHDVLADIDPPLNLKGMAISPVRSRLKELRRDIR
ncbi:DUF6884 domain-containing protein [Rhodococcus sp. IEGM 1306]|uniref:DUF6884 domain-containing protein n=1 Tax=Rhodococcus sp. IEGM 1306 TaxID=3111764 RepID=UPI003FA6E774